MTDRTTRPADHPTLVLPGSPVSRRRFLTVLGGTGLGLVACTNGSGSAGRAPAPSPRPVAIPLAIADAGPPPALAAPEDRVLVIVELSGGNDGLSTVVPANDDEYRRLRGDLALDPDEVHWLDDDVGLHPRLERLARHGVATVEGVGSDRPDLSHFAMEERWMRGDVRGTTAARDSVLARLTAAVSADGRPFGAVSVSGTTHHLSASPYAVALSDPDALWFLRPDLEWPEAAGLRGAWAAAGSDRAGDVLLRRSAAQLNDLAARLSSGGVVDRDWEDPLVADSGPLGPGLALAADLIEAEVGVRVIHASLGGFDTHDGHAWAHDDLMHQLDLGIGGFLDRLDERGLAESVVVATTSEFGRRLRANSSGGLDHGTASTMLVAGAIGSARHGEPSSLTSLDADDNLIATTNFDRYLASLGQEWMGVDADWLLPEAAEPLGLWA